MLIPDSEAAPLKVAAFDSGLSIATLRRLVRKHGIGRQASAGATIRISMPALTMIRHGDLETLDKLKAGQRDDPRVREYVMQRAEGRASHLTTSAHSRPQAARAQIPIDRLENEMAATPSPLDSSRMTSSFRRALEDTSAALGISALDYCLLAAATRMARRDVPFEGVFRTGDFDAARAKVKP